jgi:hypothetical protein
VRSRILSDDPASGMRRIHHYDPDTEDVIIETTMDVEPIIEHNKALRAVQGSKFTGRKFDPKLFAHHVRAIPLHIWYDLKRKGILGGSLGNPTIMDEKALVKWANDSDNSAWRTHDGKI